jgi:hypothetical protein
LSGIWPAVSQDQLRWVIPCRFGIAPRQLIVSGVFPPGHAAVSDFCGQ